MAYNQAAYQQFQDDWNKTLSWASQNKIPQSAILPVYQMDQQRLLNYGANGIMSQAERVRALQSSASGQAVTPLPQQDTYNLNPFHDISSLFHNAVTDLQNIFTGLSGVPSAIIDTIKNSIEHPSSVYGIVYNGQGSTVNMDWNDNLKNFADTVLSPHDIWSFVPGMTDIARLMQGKSGVKEMADNPITSLLDVMPLGSSASRLLSGTRFGSMVADAAGVTPEEISGISAGKAAMSPGTIAWKILKNRPTSYQGVRLAKTAKGEIIPVFKTLSVGDKWEAYKNAKGMGSEQAGITAAVFEKDKDLTDIVSQLTGPAVKAIGDLSSEDADTFQRIIQNDFRPMEDVIHDTTIPFAVRSAYETFQDYRHDYISLKIANGDMQLVKTFYNDDDHEELYSARPGSSGQRLVDLKDTADRLKNKAETLGRRANKLILKQQDQDVAVKATIEGVAALKAQVWDSIKASIPEMESDDPALEPLKYTLDRTERFQQTYSGITLTDLIGRQATLADAKVIRRLFMGGGILDMMTDAYESQNWNSFRDAAKYADNKIKGLKITGAKVPFAQIQGVIPALRKYGMDRIRTIDQLDKMMTGLDKNGKKITGGPYAYNRSQAVTDRAYVKASQEYAKYALEHPPDVWRNVILEQYSKGLLQNEEAAKAIDGHLKTLAKANKWSDTEVAKARMNPQHLAELIHLTVGASFSSAEIPGISEAITNQIRDDANKYVAELRSQGLEPAYLPTITHFDQRVGANAFNVFIGTTHIPTDDAVIERAFDYGNSIYNMQAAILHSAREHFTRAGTIQFMDQEMPKHLYNGNSLKGIFFRYKYPELSPESFNRAEVTALFEQTLDEWGLQKFNPESIFGGLSLPTWQDDVYYINKDVASALKRTINEWQKPAIKVLDKATNVFRTSILGYSRRWWWYNPTRSKI
jgi:hypothetical protein